MAKAVLLTRPEGKNQPLKNALEAEGIPVSVCPLIALHPVALDAQARQNLYDLDQADWILSVSAKASEAFIEEAEALWPQWPVGMRLLAVGQAAAEPLKAAGLSVETPKIRTSEGLLAECLPETLTEQTVLILKGRKGRQLLEAELLARGARVRGLAFYERVQPEKPSHMAGLFETIEGVQLTSGQAFLHLQAWLEHHPEFRSKTYFVPSQRLRDQVIQAGCQRCFLCEGAEDSAFLEAILKWQAS